MNVPLHTGDEFGILLRQKIATISVRETNRTKKSMSTTAQTYWQSLAEIWEGQRNYSLKNEVDKDAISSFSIRKDWRFAVRAKSFALHWRSRGFFRGHVRSCEKGLMTEPVRATIPVQNGAWLSWDPWIYASCFFSSISRARSPPEARRSQASEG